MSERAKEPDLSQSDAYEGAPHPRFAKTLVGHRDAELTLLNAYRQGRLAHAWLIGGKPGIGKATLAWRFARFALAYPDPSARAVREAADLSVPQDHAAAKLLAANAHPDFALLRREWNPKAKALFTDDPHRRRQGPLRGFSPFRGVRRLARRDRRQRRRPQQGERQRAAQDDRGAAAALVDPHCRAPAGAGACDHPFALPQAHARTADAG